MPRRPLIRDVALDVLLAATCTRHRYTRDPEPVVAELTAIAGTRTDVLARVAGGWAGYYESADTSVLAAALRSIPGAEPWIVEGQRGREQRIHSAPAYGR